MPVIFITGISTSGKSSVAKELRAKGFTAYDLEHNGMSAWFHKETGTRDAEFGQVPERTEAWMNSHEWRISIDMIRAIIQEAGDSPLFLCGGGANESELVPLCDYVVWLKTDEETIRSRVNNPRDHTYGTQPHELADAIAGNISKEQYYRGLGATFIDSRKQLDEVIIEITALLE